MPLLADINQSQEVIEYLKKYINNPSGFLLLAGKNGTGKTFAAHCIYSEFKKPDWREHKIFITQSELNIKWQKDLSRWGSTMHLLDELRDTELLILDDLGTRIPTEAFMDFLYAIIDKRWQDRDKKGTIITTNLNANSMREKFGDALVSRIASGKVFRLDGEDRRFIDF